MAEFKLPQPILSARFAPGAHTTIAVNVLHGRGSELLVTAPLRPTKEQP